MDFVEVDDILKCTVKTKQGQSVLLVRVDCQRWWKKKIGKERYFAGHRSVYARGVNKDHDVWTFIQCSNFLSSSRSVVVPPKKSTISTAAMGIPANAVSVVSSLDSAQAPDLSGESPGE